MANKENQRVTLTRRLLLEALLQLLEKKHINDVSVTELCRCAGINRATFYKHYATPNDVLEEYINVHVGRLIELQNPAHGKTSLQVIEESCEYIHAHADVLKIFIRNRLDEDFFRSVFLQMLHERMYMGKQFTAGFDEDDLKLTISYFASGCYFLIRRWLMEDVPKSPREIADLLLRLMPPGLLEQ